MGADADWRQRRGPRPHGHRAQDLCGQEWRLGGRRLHRTMGTHRRRPSAECPRLRTRLSRRQPPGARRLAGGYPRSARTGVQRPSRARSGRDGHGRVRRRPERRPNPFSPGSTHASAGLRLGSGAEVLLTLSTMMNESRATGSCLLWRRSLACAVCLLTFLPSLEPVLRAAAWPSSTETVGRRSGHRIVTPVNQVVTPQGTQIELPGMRPLVVALSPDGNLLVTSGKKSELLVLDPKSGQVRQRVAFPSEKQNEPQPEAVSGNILQPDKKGQVSYTGLAFSPDGRRIYLSNVNGSVKVFEVARNGTVTGSFSI